MRGFSTKWLGTNCKDTVPLIVGLEETNVYFLSTPSFLGLASHIKGR